MQVVGKLTATLFKKQQEVEYSQVAIISSILICLYQLLVFYNFIPSRQVKNLGNPTSSQLSALIQQIYQHDNFRCIGAALVA
jgi:hypothetical protein